MPQPETSDKFEEVVYWEKAGVNRRGEPTVREPIEITVRWSPTVTNSNQATQDLSSFSARVSCDERELIMGSILWYGEKESLPETPTDLHRVSKRDSSLDVRGRETRVDYLLERFNDRLPTIV